MDGAPAFQPPAIVVERLRKDYGRLRAVDGVSFQVRRGEIYALLGPCGARLFDRAWPGLRAEIIAE
jgi:ABC-2 type transport system ATP-binding protein